jgi:hypothetical protein
MARDSFHIQFFPANDVWPVGGWSVYQITGDEIADRIVKRDGKVVERHGWCGYVGIAPTLEGVIGLIKDVQSEQVIPGAHPKRVKK